MNECAEMLDALGVTWVQAVGEAESAAAKLNAEGKVDAVITDDSDAFCYGAATVLRNFTISGKVADIAQDVALRDTIYVGLFITALFAS